MSGPLPDTTDVSILVTSSFALANSSHLTVAPVWALNWFPMSVRQALTCSGNCVLVPTSTSRVLPEPLVPPPPPPPLLPPQAASTRPSADIPASASTGRLLVKPMTVLLRLGRAAGCDPRDGGGVARWFP